VVDYLNVWLVDNANVDTPLGVNVFTAPEKSSVGERPLPIGPPLAWDPTTSTLIFGERDAVLVDSLTTVPEATALADWVALHHRNLTTIYVTHGHFDHYFGLSVLLSRFPQARAIATPKTVQLMKESLPRSLAIAQRCWPGQVPQAITVPEPYGDGSFALEEHELHIIEQGHSDAVDTTSLYVPDVDLVVAGDVLYNECHMFVGNTTPESRAEWTAALDRLAALRPRTAVAGHKKPGAPDTAAAIETSKQYLIDFGRLKEAAASEEELFNEMVKRYPDFASPQAWLMFGLSSTGVRE
jgi:glyoxylase-like metal-dependent hydrolase (beta-lactamase superfamily II)